MRTKNVENIKNLTGVLLIFFCISVVGVTAYVYEQTSQTLNQNIMEIASITLKNSDLGTIKEGETRTYTKAEIPDLGDAIVVTVDDSVSLINLNIDSDLDLFSDHYSRYDVLVRFSQTVGSTHSEGDVACILSIGSEDHSSIELDAAGTWSFDLEVTTTAKSIDSNTPASVTINVVAESES